MSLAYAANPTFWQVSNEAEFAKGDVENLSIDSYGRLTLGPSTTSIYDASAPFLWSMLSAPDGSMYVGSGNEGQVYKVDSAGKGSVFFDADELEVHALALAPGGGLYAATSPDGKIYKIDSAGKSSVLFDPPDKYIWGLAVDKTGNVFAATGDKGIVYKITPDGKGQKFFASKNKSDAVMWAQTARAAATAAAGAATAGDAMKATTEVGNLQATCKQCHGMYREMDPANPNGFRIKPGVIAGS